MATGIHQPFVPIANVCKYKISGTWQGTPWAMISALKYGGDPPTGAQLTTLAGQIHSSWLTAWQTFYSNSYVQNAVQIWDLSSNTGSSGTDGQGFSGTASATTMPVTSACVVISWHVNVRYRGGHFRTYMPLAAQSQAVGGNTISGATATAYQNAAQQFQTLFNALQLNGQNIVMGGVHYLPPRTVPKTSGQFYQFQPAVVRHRIDTQRRRLGKEVS